MYDLRVGLAITAVSVVVTLAALETALRRMTAPDENSRGLLLGVPLPPLKIVPTAIYPTDKSRPYRDLVVDGVRVTAGDLWPTHRPDPILGYTVQEDAASPNGWWRSNNIGARRNQPTTSQIPRGLCRLLVFGDSFGQSSRVRDYEAWTNQLEGLRPDLEVINLAVDGYSMAQAHLRYLAVSRTLEFDGSLMMFAPTYDLWRDINTLRGLVHLWHAPVVMPRYMLENNQLVLVASPYSDPAKFYAENRDQLSPRLRRHLRKFDRFYFPLLYEQVTLVGRLYISKFAASVLGGRAKAHLEATLEAFDTRAEAMAVSRAIFEDMAEREANQGRSFTLAILPAPEDLGKGANPQWMAMVVFMCRKISRCVDLHPALSARQRDLDVGYDGTHYGPKANALIAAALAAEMGESPGPDRASLCARGREPN